ncbi:rRNA-processing protein UTP23 homolog [Daphnia magna]|uniref:UTP23 sensor motif region domain-containing protein n=1 Tax=Daphnia magna TaxID=35525 RepID=A0ABR0BAV3_9CRUS|nr:rRNA-processing protein UTP23 homolog [Daphnia magna]KAK4045712.1 hypothetical protein OUZ56_033584 [Daphnia magna]
MKITQKRKVNRYMSFFRNNYGFRVPYQVLVDGTLCLAALEGQVRVSEQLSKYFQCELKLLTTQCVILEMEKIGPSINGALSICKQFAVHKCGHEKKPVLASKCLESMIADNNPNRYIIATQDPSLREVARAVPGTPVLYLHFRSPTLEKPSQQSTELAGATIKSSIHDQGCTMERLRQLKKQELGSQTGEEKRFKRKKAKGPNPLSCKKKKKKIGTREPLQKAGTSSDQGVRPRKRKRVKIADHIRQELAARLNVPKTSD